MRGQPDTYAAQSISANASNTNTTSVVIAANAEQSWVIEQVIWSIDRTALDDFLGNDVHLDIIDVTANTINFEVGINAQGANQITFAQNGLVFPKGHAVTVRITDEGANILEDHLVVIYK